MILAVSVLHSFIHALVNLCVWCDTNNILSWRCAVKSLFTSDSLALRYHGDHDRGGSAEPDVGRRHAGGSAGDAGRPQRRRVGGQRRRGRRRGHGRAGPGQQRLIAVEDTHSLTLWSTHTHKMCVKRSHTHTHIRFPLSTKLQDRTGTVLHSSNPPLCCVCVHQEFHFRNPFIIIWLMYASALFLYI